jgi:hypothetical protein
MNAPEAPFFVAPHQEESEGVDYLGLRATNLAMMGELLPGINNVVISVRPFSLMAWIAWKYEGCLASSGRPASTKDFERFREKVETLFVWTHVQASTANALPGNQQVDAGTPVLDFQFKPFSRNASLLDAALYGPSMKTMNGLGFIFGTEGFFKVTDAGRALAVGLDSCLQEKLTRAQYEFVSSLEVATAARAGLDGILAGWHADGASEAERVAFADRLYQPKEIGRAGPHSRRSMTLHLVLEHLRAASDAMDVDTMRQRLAVKPLPAAVIGHPAAEVFGEVRRYWQVLQVRQAQRLGLEALFGWVERCLVHDNATSVSELVALTLEAFTRDGNGVTLDDNFVASRLAHYAQGGLDADALFAAGSEDGGLSIFEATASVEVVTWDVTNKSPLAFKATELLIQCAAFAGAFGKDDFAAGAANEGPRFRVPLGYWGEMVRSHQALPLRDFLRKVFETFLISQHLGIAASRAGDERSRMRISIEDRGLTSLLPSAAKVFKPVRTADRLASAMALMHSCGLIEADVPARVASGAGPRFSA